MRKTSEICALLLFFCITSCSCSGSNTDIKKDLNNNNGITVISGLENKPVLVGNIDCSFPLVTDSTKLNVLSTKYNEDVDYNNLFVWNKYEEMTGVDINWTTITKSDRKEAVYTALMNKTAIDLIMRCKISSDTLTQYGDSGLILDLSKDGMLEKYAPNCWAYLKSHPVALSSITNPDGSIYSLPQINSGAELRVSRKIFINKTWLENVKMNVPKTTQEFYQLLKAFKEQDANGNGDPNDEIPFCSQDWSSIQESFYGSFGLANRGIHNLLVDYDEKNNKVRLIASTDGYKDFLTYFNKLYSESLLDNSIFTIETEQWLNNASHDLIGVFASTNLATLPADKAANWIALEEALTGPKGDKLCSAVRENFHSTGAAVIPATCKNPELVLRWLDYFWTDEGTLFYHMGIENETFIEKDDGTYDYLPSIYNKISNTKSFDDIVAGYSPYPGGSNPTVEIAPYFMGGEMADIPAIAAKKLFKYAPKDYWPSFTFTTDEKTVLDTVQTDIEKYTSTLTIEFITGIQPLSKWDAYKKHLDKLNASKMLDIYQKALTRYTLLKNTKK